MCALTLAAPVRGTEMGMQLQVRLGVCVPRHELIMQPRSHDGPLITLGLCFKFFLCLSGAEATSMFGCTAVDPILLMHNRTGTSGDDSFMIFMMIVWITVRTSLPTPAVV